MNILFFTEISPFPIYGGSQIRSYGLIKALSEIGCNIDVIVQNKNNVNLDEFRIKNVNFIPYTPDKPILIYRGILKLFVANKCLLRIFKQILSQKKVSVAFLDFMFIGQYISFFKKRGIRVIYGTHNSQSNLHNQKPTYGIKEYLIKKCTVIAKQFHEKVFFPKADIIIVVSEPDKLFHAKFCDSNKIVVVPNFLDESRYINRYDKEDYIIMTANFNAFMNRDGLKWLITSVWDNELDNACQLFLVGRGSKQALSAIYEANRYKNIKAIGEVDNINSYIGKAKAAIIPLLHGSGTRLKCIEAMALRTNIISTEKGVEGCESNHFTIANDPISFKNAMVNVSNSENKGDLLFSDFMAKYSLYANKKILKNILDSF